MTGIWSQCVGVTPTSSSAVAPLPTWAMSVPVLPQVRRSAGFHCCSCRYQENHNPISVTTAHTPTRTVRVRAAAATDSVSSPGTDVFYFLLCISVPFIPRVVSVLLFNLVFYDSGSSFSLGRSWRCWTPILSSAVSLFREEERKTVYVSHTNREKTHLLYFRFSAPTLRERGRH